MVEVNNIFFVCSSTFSSTVPSKYYTNRFKSCGTGYSQKSYVLQYPDIEKIIKEQKMYRNT